ncbi:MAG: ArsB/NhaD family transporter [Candidatus Brocadiia bacterium]
MEFLAPYHLWIAVVIFIATYAIIASEKIHKTAIAVFGGSLMLLCGVISQGEAFHSANFEQVDVVQLEYILSEPGSATFAQLPLAQYSHSYLQIARDKEVPMNLLDGPMDGDPLKGPPKSDAWQVKFHKHNSMSPAYFEVNGAGGVKIIAVDRLIGGVASAPESGWLSAEESSRIESFWKFEGEGARIYTPTMMTYVVMIPGGDGSRYAKFHVNRILSTSNFRQYKTFTTIASETGQAASGVVEKKEEDGTVVRETATIEPNYVEVVDWNVIILLAAMMLIVGIMRHSGIFQYIAIKAAHMSKGNPVAILILMSVVTAILSAFLDNVTTVVLTVPVTITVARTLKINPIPMLIAQIIASNIGGTATLIGDPPNIMIGSATTSTPHPLGFVEFIVELTPVVVVILIATVICFYFIWRKAFKVAEENKAKVMAMDASKAITDKGILIKSLFTLAVVMTGFFLHGMLHLQPATVALFGAGLLFVLTRPNMEKTFHDVEWPTLFFFLGLFIIVGGLQRVGMIAWIAEQLRVLSDNQLSIACYLILWTSAILSAVIDNIPFVATMIPVVKQMGAEITHATGLDSKTTMDAMWWALSLGACLGGNGTAIGASANVVTIGIAEKEGYHISFMKYLKYGFPLMILSIVIAHIYLWLFYIRPAMQ